MSIDALLYQIGIALFAGMWLFVLHGLWRIRKDFLSTGTVSLRRVFPVQLDHG